MAKPNSGALVNLSSPSPGVAIVTLNLPEVRNAMTAALTQAWVATMDEAGGRPGPARPRGHRQRPGVLLRSRPVLARPGQHGREHARPPAREDAAVLPGLARAPRYLSIPVIAAVNGPGRRRRPVPGPGLRPAVRRARGHLQRAVHRARHARRHGGELAAAGGDRTATGPRDALHGPGRQRRRGPPVGADQWRGRQRARPAVDVAAGIAAAAPIAARLTKAGLAQAAGGGFEAALQWEALAQPVTMSTADIHEGIRARRERRAPTFEGGKPASAGPGYQVRTTLPRRSRVAAARWRSAGRRSRRALRTPGTAPCAGRPAVASGPAPRGCPAPRAERRGATCRSSCAPPCAR